jgi:hypothetical protein
MTSARSCCATDFASFPSSRLCRTRGSSTSHLTPLSRPCPPSPAPCAALPRLLVRRISAWSSSRSAAMLPRTSSLVWRPVRCSSAVSASSPMLCLLPWAPKVCRCVAAVAEDAHGGCRTQCSDRAGVRRPRDHQSVRFGSFTSVIFCFHHLHLLSCLFVWLVAHVLL